MKPIEQQATHSRSGLNAIIVMLFGHRWTILVCALAGFAGAAMIYFLKGRDYESRAKLLVRYVVERSAVDDPKVNTTDPKNDTIINSEVEILTSLDLATQVADTVGVERLVGNSGGGAGVAFNNARAVKTILDGIHVESRKGSNVISVAYRSRDPELARAVLDEHVKRYFDKHLELHRSTGAFGLVTDQTQQARSRLRLTEDELHKAQLGPAQAEPQIAELERKKEVEEANLKQMESVLDKARIDEALGLSKTPYISIIQKPSAGAKVTGETKKLMLAVAGGGLCLGVGLALLIELLLNRNRAPRMTT